MGESDLLKVRIEGDLCCFPHVATWVVPGDSTFCNKCGLYLYSF